MGASFPTQPPTALCPGKIICNNGPKFRGLGNGKAPRELSCTLLLDICIGRKGVAQGRPKKGGDSRGIKLSFENSPNLFSEQEFLIFNPGFMKKMFCIMVDRIEF